MAVVDSYIQVPPDSTGAKVDNSELTRADATVVERQRVNISDPEDTNAHAAVRNSAASFSAYGVVTREIADATMLDLLNEIRVELVLIREIIFETLARSH